MGQPDQFAKRTFEEETARLTHGAVTWKDPPEVSLTHIQGDGRFLVRRSRRRLRLTPPWEYVRGHDEISLEIKMAGEHLGLAAIERILLRRQARQVERVEDPEAPFSGQGPIWAVAPHVSEVLRKVWKVHRTAPGCYQVGPFVFPFVWIAANELPLRDDSSRSSSPGPGAPWTTSAAGWRREGRRSGSWTWYMYTAMSSRARVQVANSIETDEPEVRARQRHLVEILLAKDPEFQQGLADQWRKEGHKEGRKDGRRKGQLAEARAILRRVLARRGLDLAANDETRIDACTTLATLEHWIEEAVVAPSAADVLGPPRHA